MALSRSSSSSSKFAFWRKDTATPEGSPSASRKLSRNSSSGSSSVSLAGSADATGTSPAATAAAAARPLVPRLPLSEPASQMGRRANTNATNAGANSNAAASASSPVVRAPTVSLAAAPLGRASGRERAGSVYVAPVAAGAAMGTGGGGGVAEVMPETRARSRSMGGPKDQSEALKVLRETLQSRITEEISVMRGRSGSVSGPGSVRGVPKRYGYAFVVFWLCLFVCLFVSADGWRSYQRMKREMMGGAVSPPPQSPPLSDEHRSMSPTSPDAASPV